MNPERSDDEAPIGHTTPSMRAVASSLTPLTAADARGRLQRRQRRQGAAALAVAVIVIAGIATQHGFGDREVTTTAGRPSGTMANMGGTVGTAPGTIPGTNVPPGTSPADATPTSTSATTTTRDPLTPTTGDSVSTSTTTTTAAAPTSTTTTGPPGSTHLTGTYKGDDQMLFATPMCPDQEHRRDEVYTFSDGTVWQYHTVFCATIDKDNVWLGTGTYTLTNAYGETLSGDFVNRAQLPTYGVPYPARVTGGTGAYTGVTGTCSIDVYLVDGPLWHVGDPNRPGTFACDLTGWPSPPPRR